MYLTEYNPERERHLIEFEVRRRVATDMLRDGEPLARIIKYSRLAEEAILRLAGSLGISVVR